MAVLSSLYILPKRLFTITEQIDEVQRKLDVYHIAWNEISYLNDEKKRELLEVLLDDLQKHAATLVKLTKGLKELMALDLPPMFIERTEALAQQLEEIKKFHQILSAKTKDLL
ncbi:MAG: hypothetical protein WC748_03950 [Legionellales bacterium]|jgi:DNA repair exonuclease SbcCD ATPase subunit